MKDEIRTSLRNNQAVLCNMKTGLGKTVFATDIMRSVYLNNLSSWFGVPRNELLKQTSKHLFKYKVPHNFINPKSNESKAFTCHVVSIDTLLRRLKNKKINKFPDLFFWDEAHLRLQQQLDIKAMMPNTKFIGLTATPERADTKGLSEMYDDIIYGPTFRESIENGYLTNFKYFAVPLEGLNELHRQGTEFDADELNTLLEQRKIFGSAIEHYGDIAQGKTSIIFTRDIKSAEETAYRFSNAGFRFEAIHGKMNMKKRNALTEALNNKKIDGLCSAEILTYGFDCPKVECIIMLRPTLSRTLYFQVLGRGIRPYSLYNIDGINVENPFNPDDNARLVYKKENCIVLDHVNNITIHVPMTSDNLIDSFDDIEWNFRGRKKKIINNDNSAIKLKICTTCFMYYEGDVCPNCGTAREIKERGNLEVVDGRLVEIKTPEIVKLKDRPREEKRDITDRINVNIMNFKMAEKRGEFDEHSVEQLLNIAKEVGRQPLSVYWQLSHYKHAVDVTLLYCIQRLSGYKNGWAYFKKQEIEKRLDERRAG
jgi:superfamily II DNA or RNA helicase